MRKDPVSREVAEAVLERDGGCVGGRIGMSGPCDGRRELDHIDTRGLGLRGPSTPENLVTLCSRHHRVKTENARLWRPVLREWTRTHG